MKTGTHRLELKMSREELEKMTKEVKETLAFECLHQNKNFSSADLWNIQRRRKSISPRRNYV
ncbi:MAG: hypothetical protein ABI741_09705 [Ferruginibacter sp.]